MRYIVELQLGVKNKADEKTKSNPGPQHLARVTHAPERKRSSYKGKNITTQEKNTKPMQREIYRNGHLLQGGATGYS